MKRRKKIQIIIPKMAPPSTAAPLTRSGTTPLPWTMRATRARKTGAPVTSSKKTVRRDHSISPSDRLNTRTAPAANVGGAGRSGRPLMLSRSCLYQIAENRLQVVVGRRDLVDRAEAAAGREVGDPRVERVGPRRLHHQATGIEPHAHHALVRQQFAGDGVRLRRADGDGMRV